MSNRNNYGAAICTLVVVVCAALGVLIAIPVAGWLLTIIKGY